jgi:hypothetical protein
MKGRTGTRARISSLEPPPLALLEEGVRLLRANPSLFLIHLGGSIPFTTFFLYYWADMSRAAYAADRMAFGALMLGVLFLLMKVAHGVFASRLLTELQQEADRPWTLGRLWRLGSTQALIQPWGLLLVPAPLVGLLVPFIPSENKVLQVMIALAGLAVGIGFAWLYAFFQGASVTADLSNGLAGVCARNAVRQALKWPAQNHGALGLLGIFALVVFVNCGVALYFIPLLLKLLLGVETEYTLSRSAFLNTTFFASAAMLAWHVIDPLAKTFYVLRTFRIESMGTGADIRARLGVLRKSLLPALVFLLFLHGSAPNVQGAETPDPAPASSPSSKEAPSGASRGEMDRAMDEVLKRRAYVWRAPREAGANPGTESEDWLTRFMKNLGDSLEGILRKMARSVANFLDWLFSNSGLRGPGPQGPSRFDWTSGLNVVLYTVLAVALGALGFFLIRFWRRNRQPPVPEVVASPVVPDLSAEEVAASQLPEDGWLSMARDLAAKGEHRLALRALYLASLAGLAHRELVSLAHHKTNRDYTREVERRARATPQLPERFKGIVSYFDRAWYGTMVVTPTALTEFEAQVHAVRSMGTPALPPTPR